MTIAECVTCEAGGSIYTPMDIDGVRADYHRSLGHVVRPVSPACPKHGEPEARPYCCGKPMPVNKECDNCGCTVACLCVSA